MKKVILSEKQIKRLMDKLIINEQETENNQQNQGNDSGKYKLYLFDGTTPYAVKNNGNDFQLFKLENGGDGSNKYKITKELSVKPIITMTQNGWPDLQKNIYDFQTNGISKETKTSNQYTPQNKVGKNGIQQYNDDGTPMFTKKGDVVYKYVPVEVQKIVDQRTENSLDEGIDKAWPVKQSKAIPNSVTDGIKCLTLGMSQLKNNVPVYGTLFLMYTERLPNNKNLKVVSSKQGNQIILDETAVKTKNGYYWLYFDGQMFGDGGYDWDPSTPINIPKNETPDDLGDDPYENTIIQIFEKGLNDAFNFDQTTLNDEGNKNLQDLINYANENYLGVSAKIPVICSASIDGDPNQKLKNGMTRSQYNMDLSKRRADAIATILSNQINVDTFEFLPQGIGETDKFDPGKKWPEVTDKNLTAGNRKLIIQLPKLQKTIQQK
jgi:outer membrane protein OmpA-like peptidoglycan-associated protein